MTRTRRTTTTTAPALPANAEALANLIMQETRRGRVTFTGLGPEIALYGGPELANAHEVIRLRHPNTILDIDLAQKTRSTLLTSLKKAIVRAENESRFR